MSTEDSRKLVVLNEGFKVISEFYSFIIIKKLRNTDQLTSFGWVGNTLNPSSYFINRINIDCTYVSR